MKTKIGNLDPPMAGALCYVPLFMINYVAPFVFFFGEPREHTSVRFHAVQSLLVTAVWLLSTFVLFGGGLLVPVVLFAIGSAIGIEGVMALLGVLIYFTGAIGAVITSFAGLVVHVVLALMTATEKNPRVPVLGSIAVRIAGSPD